MRPRDRLEIRQRLAPERLEARLALTASPAVVIDSVSTADSQGVTVVYDVNSPASPSTPVTIDIDRSAAGTYDPSAETIGSETLIPAGATRQAPTLDDSGNVADAVGRHTLTIPLPGGLTPNPERPYVLAVANPSGGPAASSAAFRVYTIGVVTHGGLENTSWKNGPAWELKMARSLLDEGYDAVIPYNWVDQSSTPGDADEQGPLLARDILNDIAQAPAGAVVDLDMIGHSEGTVVNDDALNLLSKEMPASLLAGYINLTMLDPHAANPDVTGQQYGVAAGPLGALAKVAIDNYQGLAHDTTLKVPSIVDNTDVFYQHTAASHDSSNAFLYNLWGEVPVLGPAHYFNLTADGITHSGDEGVYSWYQRDIVPLLGNGAPTLLADTLAGASPDVSPSGVAITRQLTYAGQAEPGATVRLDAGPAADPSKLIEVGTTTADASGQWTITTRPLQNGRDRLVASAFMPKEPGQTRLRMIPIAPLGKVVIDEGT